MKLVIWQQASFALFSFSLLVQKTTGDTSITDVRFVNATAGNPGPVEVQYDGEWYRLCADSDYGREALVICRQIGYIGGWAQFFQTASPRGFNPMCGGSEETLGSCDYFKGVNSPQNCMEDVSVGVWCYNSSDIHLVDAPSERPNIGRVQVQYDETVTDVCFEGASGNDRLWSYNGLQDEVLCRQLGYPGALMASAITIQNRLSLANIYTDDYKCVSGMTNLYNCLPDEPVSGRCTNDMYVHAVCAIPGYFGCFTNSNTDSTGDPNMTTQICIELCRRLPLPTRYALLRAGNGCRCQNGVFSQLNRVADSECNIPCSGDPYDICGGPLDTANPSRDRISVYEVAVRMCGEPDVPMNGFIINVHDKNVTYEFGAIVQIACNNGFVLVEFPSIQCVVGHSRAELVWNASIPVCQEVTTPVLPIPTLSVDIDVMDEQTTSSFTGAIIGVSIGCAIFLTFTILISFYIFKRFKKNQDPKLPDQNDSEVYVIPSQAFEHPRCDGDMQQESVYTGLDSSQQQTSEYDDLTNPDNLKTADNYLNIDVTIMQEEQEYQDLINPAALKTEDDYLGLDSKSRQTEPEYQDLTNPGNLKTADNYMSLDADSRQAEQDYQDVNYKPSLPENNGGHPGRKRSLRVPVPPQVEVIANSDGPYVNVKELTK